MKDNSEWVVRGGGKVWWWYRNKRKKSLPKSMLTIYSDLLLETELITISDWFQTEFESFPLIPIPPPSSPICLYIDFDSLFYC